MPVKEYLEAEETSLIEAAAVCPRDKLLIRLLRRTGCRVSEVLALEEKHIDFVNHHIRIEHEKMRLNLNCPECAKRGEKTHLGRKHVFCPKCGAPVSVTIAKETQIRHLRKIPLDKDTLQMVREYIAKGGAAEVNGKSLLFKFTRQWAWNIVKSSAIRAGFTVLENPENERKHHVSPHNLRDAFAINAMKKRSSFDDARLLQELLGHAKIDTTMHYRKVKITELKDYMNDLMEEG